MQHGDIWRGLDELAARSGLSTSGLARLAGLDATAFNKSKRQSKDGRLRWPTTESISRVLAAVNVDFADFALLVAGGAGRKVPLLREHAADADGVFTAEGAVNRSHDRDLDFGDLEMGADAFLFEITGSGLEPHYNAGDQVVVVPGAPLKAGDHALIMTSGGAVCVAMAEADASSTGLIFISISYQTDAYSASDLKWASKVSWVRP